MATIKLDEMVPAVQEEKQLAIPSVSSLPAGMTGEISMDDVKLPSLKLVGKTSEMANEFPAGSWVFDGSVMVSDGKTPFNVVVVQFAKRYQEVRPYDEDNSQPPLVLDTMNQVRAAGGGFEKDSAKQFMPIAHIQLLIEAPASLDEADKGRFSLAFENKRYTLAVFSALSRTAYSAVGREITSAAIAGALKESLAGAVWEMSSELIKTAKNSWWGPKIKVGSITTKEFQNWVAKIGNTGN